MRIGPVLGALGMDGGLGLRGLGVYKGFNLGFRV